MNETIFKWHLIAKEDGFEDLPKQSDTYLVSTLSGEDGKIKVDSYTSYFDSYSNTWEVIDNDIVIAWAPNPKPYMGTINLNSLVNFKKFE